MNAIRFDRHSEDQGNIVSFEHVNVQIPDQRLATLFYVEGHGLTRDPYMHVTDANMWVNAGRNQFHLPNRLPTQVFRGTIALVLPSLDAVRERLKRVAPRLAGTKFTWTDEGETLLATCPWGNRLRSHQAGPRFAPMRLGIPYVEFPVARGTAEGIARFYRSVLKTLAWTESANGAAIAKAKVGVGQHLIYRESDRPIEAYDGHHVAIYTADFSGPHHWLEERGLITEESDPCQYRFEAIVDPDDGRELFRLHHEVRSLSHPMFVRQWNLVNRNPDQDPVAYITGRDTYYPA